MKAFNSACLAIAFAGSAAAAEGDYTRSLEIEQLAALAHVMTCRVQYRNLNPAHTYTVSLTTFWNGTTDRPEGVGTVNLHNRTATSAGPGWTFNATMKKDRIDAVIERQLDGPVNTGAGPIYCTSRGTNNSTGNLLPTATQSDSPDIE